MGGFGSFLAVFSVLIAHSHILSILTMDQSSFIMLFCTYSKAVPIVMMAIASTFKSPYAFNTRLWTFLALACSAVGDVFLLSAAEDALIRGLGAFLLAHVFYIFKFVAISRTFRPGYAFLYSLVAACLLYSLWPFLPQHMLLPVVVYGSVLSLMAERAAECFGAVGAIGGFLFVASDWILATNQFRWSVANETILGFDTTSAEFQKYARVAVMLTYYGSQFLLNLEVLSSKRHSKHKSQNVRGKAASTTAAASSSAAPKRSQKEPVRKVD
eukprot:ANDGO_01409.mRNA.1 hypothetical protein